MSEEEKRLLAAYEAAMQALSPLPRAVFLLHRLDGWAYDQIGARLSIDQKLVAACLARALTGLAGSMAGDRPFGPEPPSIIAAEASLLKEHMAYRARRALLRALNLPRLPEARRRLWPPSHWVAALQRWLRSSTMTENRYAVPPARTFDEWLRQREGPPNLDTAWPMQPAVL